MSKKKIAIIGGGPMGLSVAYELSRNPDAEIEIYEAGNRLGGMTVSFDFDGLQIERFYHFICKGDQPLFDLLAELGISDKLHFSDTRMGYYYKGGLFEWGNPIALLTFPHIDFITKIRYGLMAFISTKRSDWERLDKVDAVTWLKTWIGEKGYNALWKDLFELKFYEYTNNLSAAWIWTRIKRVGSSRKSLLQETLGYLEGGSETLLSAMAREIERRGVKVHLSQPIERVELEDGKVSGIVAGGEFTAFDAVVSTAPLPYVPKFVPDMPTELLGKFKAVDNIGVVCIIVKLKRAVSPYFWLNIVDERMDIPGIVEYSNLNPLADHIVYIPYYVPTDNPIFSDTDETFEEKARAYLTMINPELTDDDFLGIEVSRYEHAQPICPPRFLEQLPPISLPVKGLFVADTSYYYPEDRGISESARLGRQIASEVEAGL